MVVCSIMRMCDLEVIIAVSEFVLVIPNFIIIWASCLFTPETFVKLRSLLELIYSIVRYQLRVCVG